MSRSFLPSQNLFLKSLLAAFFFHVFFFSIFVFTFPKRFEGHKPQLISLGSILEPQDVAGGLKHPSGSPAGVRDAPEQGIVIFVYEFFEMAQNPSRETDVSKPVFGGKALSAGEKMSIKPMFDQGQVRPEAGDEPVIDDGIPSYRPLRLFLYD